jgi:hypothetical protein
MPVLYLAASQFLLGRRQIHDFQKIGYNQAHSPACIPGLCVRLPDQRRFMWPDRDIHRNPDRIQAKENL